MIKEVVKRDGRVVPFDECKIRTAVQKAMNEVNYPHLGMADCVVYPIRDLEKETMSVEDIQDEVEKLLIQCKLVDVAKAYIRYRYDHEKVRDFDSEIYRKVHEKLGCENVENQNANVDERSFGGRSGEVTRSVLKQYALDKCMSSMSKRNHLNNEIYIHDLDSYALGMHNCLSMPIDDLLANGFKTRQTDVRPANSISTAMQLVAVLFQIQSLQQFGGVSSTHTDHSMVPYVRKSFSKHFKDGMEWIYGVDFELDKDPKELSIEDDLYKNEDTIRAYDYALSMTEKETHQAVEGLFHNLNTLQSRSGNQLPFSSINFGTCTLPEGRMVTKAILEVSIEGLGAKKRTSVFPCQIFQCMKGVNREKGDPNYDLFQLALKSTSQRLYPNYANVDWSGNAGYDRDDPRTYFSTMGCRTANGWDINGFGQLKDGRGNICPVTIILPTVAMESLETLKDGEDKFEHFLECLDTKIHEAKEMLLERFEFICSQNPASASFMYENNTMAGYIPEEGIRSALKHGTLALGQIGLAECLQALFGFDHTYPKGMEYAKQIENLFKTRCNWFKNQYHLNFGNYYTPAENLCHTALKKFRDKYGVIPNVSDKEFFTNSIHVPVWTHMNPFSKIDIESQLTGYSSAGCITYVEFDAACKYNLNALETVVNYAMDKDIPYFAVNVPNDHCEDCGYTDVIGDHCPVCGGDDISRLRRVTGYLTGDYNKAFNPGKVQEVELRVKHQKF